MSTDNILRVVGEGLAIIMVVGFLNVHIYDVGHDATVVTFGSAVVAALAANLSFIFFSASAFS